MKSTCHLNVVFAISWRCGSSSSSSRSSSLSVVVVPAISYRNGSCHDYQWSQWLLLLLPSITRQVHVLWVFILRQNEELPYLPASPFALGWHRAVGFCKTTTSLLPRRWDMWRTQLGGYFSSIDMCCQLHGHDIPELAMEVLMVDLSLYMVHFVGKPWLKTRVFGLSGNNLDHYSAIIGIQSANIAALWQNQWDTLDHFTLGRCCSRPNNEPNMYIFVSLLGRSPICWSDTV